MTETDMNTNYVVIGCLPNFSISTDEFLKYIRININTKTLIWNLKQKTLSVIVGFIGRGQ